MDEDTEVSTRPTALKSTPNGRYFWEAFHSNFIYNGNRNINFRISFCWWWLTWGLAFHSKHIRLLYMEPIAFYIYNKVWEGNGNQEF